MSLDMPEIGAVLRNDTFRTIKEGPNMPRKSNSEVTGRKAATAASKVLRNPKSSQAAKTAAASALTQRPNKKK